MPKLIRPYKITKGCPAQSRYMLTLPSKLVKHRIHPMFHISRLKPHSTNNDPLFPKREVHMFYDFEHNEEGKWLVDEILSHRWEGKKLMFLVQWNLGDTTWEPFAKCRELAALNQYLELLGIGSVEELPHRDAEVKKRRH